MTDTEHNLRNVICTALWILAYFFALVLLWLPLDAELYVSMDMQYTAFWALAFLACGALIASRLSLLLKFISVPATIVLFVATALLVLGVFGHNNENMREQWHRHHPNKPLGKFEPPSDNRTLTRSGEARLVGRSRQMLYSGLVLYVAPSLGRQTLFTAGITRTLFRLRIQTSTRD